jgi:hypothetical protein
LYLFSLAAASLPIEPGGNHHDFISSDAGKSTGGKGLRNPSDKPEKTAFLNIWQESSIASKL